MTNMKHVITNQSSAVEYETLGSASRVSNDNVVNVKNDVMPGGRIKI
jgi:hypothetical protein